ncbi:hypothetical protein, partial [Intestinimonas butyriciproducens]|uniref:hypothetical protein n=1 Tax=Intestinimonas butyriciproducens TaxID=1297617 RepID=UPI00195E7042
AHMPVLGAQASLILCRSKKSTAQMGEPTTGERKRAAASAAYKVPHSSGTLAQGQFICPEHVK